MADDQISPNVQPIGQNQPASQASSGRSLSPWDDDLEEDKPAPQVVGSLSGAQRASGQAPVSFNVPKNIENNTPLTIKTPSDFENIKNVDQNIPAGLNGSQADFSYGKDSYSAAEEATSEKSPATPIKPAEIVVATPPAGVKGLIMSDSKPQGIINNVAPGLTQVSSSTSAPTASIPTTNNPVPQMPVLNQNIAAPTIEKKNDETEIAEDDDIIDIFDDSPTVVGKDIGGDIKPVAQTKATINTLKPINKSLSETTSASSVPVQPNAMAQPTSQVVAPVANPVPTTQAPSGGLLELLKKNRETQVQTSPANINIQTPATNIQNPVRNINQPQPQPQIQPVKARQPFKMTARLMIPLIVLGIVSIFSIMVYLTELGIMSLGFENLYNTIGVEKLWGGLSKDPADAVPRSLFELGKNDKFKVTGNLSMTVDKTIDSQVTTPLVSFKSNNLADNPQKAKFVVYEDYSTDSETSFDEYDSLDSGEYTVEEDISSSSSSGLSSDYSSDDSVDSSFGSITEEEESSFSASSIDITEQDMAESYEEIANKTADVNSEISAYINKNGSEAELEIERATGIESISLKNEQDKLWVKSDNIFFSGNAEPGKWLEYNISALAGSDILTQLFSENVDMSGFSVVGQRVGNEKISDVRCYNYQIDSLEVGNILMGVGIMPEMIQSINGNVWIGIKDKTLRKIDFKIILAPSLSIKDISLNLEFGSFGQENSFAQPDVSEIIEGDSLSLGLEDYDSEEIYDDSSGYSESDLSSDELSSSSSSSSIAPVVDSRTENDNQRKADLILVAEALEKYKANMGSYPKSSVLVKLNTSGNLLSSSLMPSYLSNMPTDPKASDGWFYGYKSADGKSYYLSAKLEDTSDPEGETLDGLYLYFLRNE